MDKNWTEMAPLGPFPSGDIGGDEQASEAHGRRFVLPPTADGLIPMLTISYYVAYHVPEDKTYTFIRRHSEMMLCADPSDPGGTEAWCEYLYEMPVWSRRTAFASNPNESDVLRIVREMSTPTLEDWDGTREHGVQRQREVAATNR